MSKIVLNDVFSQWLNDKGIIKTLTDNYDVPWKNVVDGSILDLEYHGNRSGGKIISPLLEKLITKNGISDENAIKLCGLIYSRNNTNWKKLWDTLSFEYNPIENYSMQEVEDSNTTNTGTIKNAGTSETNNTGTIDNVGNASTTNTGTVTINNDTSGENNLYGFNSSNPVGDSTNSGTSDTTTTNDLTENVNTNNKQTNNIKEKTDTDTTQTNNLNFKEDRTLTRKGNIGVTTSQQMITQERTLWDWKFFDRVFSDIDMIVVTQVYGELHDSLDGLVINNNYVLPKATSTTLGGIKVGDNLTIDNNGRLSATADTSQIEEEINTINTELPKKYSADNPPPYPVTSVNGKTGNVIIDAPTEIKLIPTIYYDRFLGITSSKSLIVGTSNETTVTTLVFDVSQYKGKYLKINYYTSNSGVNRQRIGFIEDISIDYQSQNCKVYVYDSKSIPANTILSYYYTNNNIMNPYYYDYSNTGYNSYLNPFYITQESNYLVIYMSTESIAEEDIQCDVRVIL